MLDAYDHEAEVSALSAPLKKRAAVFAFYSVLLTQPPDCAGPAEHVFQQFELPSCPDETFALPQQVDRAPYSLQSGRRPWHALSPGFCPGATVYSLRQQSRKTPLLFFDVKLIRGQSCGLEVGYSYALALGQSEDFSRAAEVVARLLMQGSGLEPSIPAARTDGFQSREDVEAWCARRLGGAQISCAEWHRLADAGQ